MVLVMVSAIATIGIVGYVTVRATRARLVNRTDTSLQNQLATAKVAVKLLTPEALLSLNQLDRVVSRESAIITLDRNGRALSALPAVSQGHNESQPVLPPLTDLRRRLGQPFNARAADRTRYRLVTGDIGSEQTIVFATPLTPVDQTIHDLTTTIVGLGGLAIAVMSVFLWLLLTAATKPIDDMIEVATKIGRGDFTARIEQDRLRGDAKRLGAALNQMVVRLAAASDEGAAAEARLRQFVADASHELRTPLTSIRGYAQLCRMGAAGDDATVAIERIESEARRMSGLVDDLLLLARLDQGRHGARTAIDLVPVVEELTADARVVEPARQIAFEAPSEPIEVFANADELRQVITNLLANVRAHTDEEVPASVTITATATDVTVVVHDDGPGMPDSDTASAFDRFFRSDASRSRRSGGSGLGLSIAKTIVEAHGGTIQFRSRSATGTSVRVCLARVRRDESPSRR